MNKNRTDAAYWALRATYGAIPIVAGADKFTNLLTDWSKYLSPVAQDMLPVGPETFMRGVGLIEIAAGALVLSPRFTRLGAYVVSGWLVAIAGNLLTGGAYDIAVRDVAMAVGAFSLARLTEAREPSVSREVQEEKKVETRERATAGSAT